MGARWLERATGPHDMMIMNQAILAFLLSTRHKGAQNSWVEAWPWLIWLAALHKEQRQGEMRRFLVGSRITCKKETVQPPAHQRTKCPSKPDNTKLLEKCWGRKEMAEKLQGSVIMNN